MSILKKIEGGLIVSCQALENEPLHGSEMMAAMAKAVVEGGAVGIRANGPEDIRAIKKVVDVPVIGIYKKMEYDSDVYITPTFIEAKAVFEAGADIIAIDATSRPRPDGISLEDYVKRIKDELGVLIMADVSTLDEGIAAREAGCDLVGTTLSGYTDYTRSLEGPDFELLKDLVEKLNVPVILEGRVNSPEDVIKGLKLGAFAVVVGTAITRPQIVTSRYVDAIKKAIK